jgi:protein involved in polysaccharide export with SLBB domain
MAGGLEDDADKTNIYIQPSGTLDRVPFDYDLARTTPEDDKANPVLKDGDKVVVPEVSTMPVFSITGAVLKPGQYTLEGKITLTDAEGLAGGLLPHAKTDQVQITRESGTGAQVIKLNTNDANVPANFLLEPGDNVYIPQGNPPKQTDPLSLLGILIGIGSIFR